MPKAAPDRFRRSRYFKWYYGRIGITDQISVVLPSARMWSSRFRWARIVVPARSSRGRLRERLRSREPVILSLLGLPIDFWRTAPSPRGDVDRWATPWRTGICGENPLNLPSSRSTTPTHKSSQPHWNTRPLF